MKPQSPPRAAPARTRRLRPVPASFLVLAVLVVAAGTVTRARADDKADMERTKIIGNRELPKVLYIVPWKKPVPGELPGRPLKSVLDEALEPVDRDVFRRQVQYQAQVGQPVVAKAAADAAPGAAPAPK